ncbi:GGDEF domain-containing protein [Blautia sp. AM16-16B]|nr:GGDEF domain-containing protein [Blautia sp. AM16-16B]
MDGYFYVLTTIDLFVLCFMCILTHLSESLSEKQKRGFFLAYLMIAGISVLEVITVVVDGLPSGYRWLNIVSNYLGFGLSPAVSVCLVYVLDRKTALRRKIRIAVCCEIAYLMFLLVSIPYGMVFSVSADNMYSRGPHFYIYVIMYFGAILYLSISTIITAREFQNRSRMLIYPLILFVMVETIIQVALPELHVTWLCVTLLSVLYFIYCNEMWNQLDALTGLLNQNSYLKQTQKIKYNSGVLVVFDVDDFKQVNDCHGHVKGDLCLAGIAECIKKAYADFGYCYRIGGDEFCVLLKNRAKEEECRQEFLRRWVEKRRKFIFLPTVSYGSAPFSGEDIAVVKDRADRDMYQYKKGRKKHGSSGVLSEQQKYQN